MMYCKPGMGLVAVDAAWPVVHGMGEWLAGWLGPAEGYTAAKAGTGQGPAQLHDPSGAVYVPCMPLRTWLAGLWHVVIDTSCVLVCCFRAVAVGCSVYACLTGAVACWCLVQCCAAIKLTLHGVTERIGFL